MGVEYFQRLSTILEGFRMALEVKDVFLIRQDSIFVYNIKQKVLVFTRKK